MCEVVRKCWNVGGPSTSRAVAGKLVLVATTGLHPPSHSAPARQCVTNTLHTSHTNMAVRLVQFSLLLLLAHFHLAQYVPRQRVSHTPYCIKS